MIGKDIKQLRIYISNAQLPKEYEKILNEYITSCSVGVGNRPLKLSSLYNVTYSFIYFTRVINKEYEVVTTEKVKEKVRDGFRFIERKKYTYNSCKKFFDITKDDIISFIAYMKEEGLAEATVGVYSILVRQFFIWLYRKEGKVKEDEYPSVVKWVKGYKGKKRLDTTKLFTPDEIKKLITVSRNDRDKALISGLYEGAFRISEWRDVKIKDIHFDDFGCKVKVSGKTGERTTRLIFSTPYIKDWLEKHPYKNNPESYFFVSLATNFRGNKLAASTIGCLLKQYTKESKIKKHIHCHLLRHSRLNWLAQKEGFNERDLRIFAGWSEDSEMPNTYLHYGEEEVDRKLRQVNGLLNDTEGVEEVKQRQALKFKICPRCEKKNEPTSLYCNCGMCLDQKESMKVEEMKDKAINEAMEQMMNIMKDPERLQKFMEFQK